MPKLDLNGIDRVIVGGESGRKPRPIEEQWVLDIKRHYDRRGVDFPTPAPSRGKQWGGTNKKKAGRMLEGRTWDAMPVMA